MKWVLRLPFSRFPQSIIQWCPFRSTNGKQTTCTWSQSINSINGLSRHLLPPVKFDLSSCTTIAMMKASPIDRHFFFSSFSFISVFSIFRNQIIFQRGLRMLSEAFAESVLCKKHTHQISPLRTENSTVWEKTFGSVNRTWMKWDKTSATIVLAIYESYPLIIYFIHLYINIK